MAAMMTRTIEPGITVFTAAEIRVAVLPIGKVPRDIYDEYSDLINQHRHVALSAARSFYRETQKSPFQYTPWNTGLLHMRFLRDEDAFRRTRMVDLHSQRQVLAVIGIVYGAASPDLQLAYQDFVKINRQFPEAFTNRCLVFEPSEQQIQQDNSAFKDLVLFPPGDVSRTSQHLEVVMHDMAASILSEVEKWMLSASPNMMKLNTYVDSGEFTGQLAVLDDLNKFRMQFTEEEIKEKRKWARLQKAKGDMCLMAGSPRDAYDNYKSALELCKVTGDAVWYAAAEEGVAHARIIEALANSTAFTQPGSPGVVDASFAEPLTEASMLRAAAVGFGGKEVWKVLREASLEQEVRELFADARTWYKRKGGAVSLQIEQQLKLARFLAGLRGLSARKEASDMMTFVMEQVGALPLQEDRLVAMVEAAQVMGLVGSSRKRALMLWQAVEQARALDKSETAALRIAIKALEPPDDPHHQDPDDGPRLHWTQRRHGVPHNWEAVHMAALEGALQAARQARAPTDAWEAAAALMREHHSLLTPSYQAQLLDMLSQAAAAMSSSVRIRPGPGPAPQVSLHRILPCTPALQAIVVQGRLGSEQEDPFIFNPYSNKRNKEASNNSNPEWVCGDDCWVEVLVSNPTAVSLKLDRMNLHVRYQPARPTPAQNPPPAGPKPPPPKADEPRPWQAVPVSLTLPPYCKAQRTHLCVKLLQPGTIALLGCQVSMWNVQWSQPFGPQPKRRAGGSSAPPPHRAGKGSKGTAAAGATPDNSALVSILPHMPLLRATVRGPDFHTTQPSDAQLQKPALQGAQEPQDKASPVQVLEGQSATWSLTLTNIGREPVAACQVAVSDQRAAPNKSGKGGQLQRTQSHFTGIIAEADMDVLTAALPLKPLDTVTVPLRLQIGRAPENFDEVAVEVRITYMPAPTPNPTPGARDTQHARCLSIPLTMQIQPTLQISAVNFLQLSTPLVDSSPVLPGEAPVLSKALQMYVDQSKGARRESSITGTSAASSQSASPQKKALDSGGSKTSKASRFSQRGGSTSREGPLSSLLLRGAELVAEEGVCLRQRCVLQLTISNTCSDRYFRAWVAPAGAQHDAAQAVSAVSVIQPGDPSTLLCVLPREDPPDTPPADHPPAPSNPRAKPPSQEELCLQYLLGRCAVYWEMITVKQSNENAPQGVLLLPYGETLKSLTPSALSMLRPCRLHITFSALSTGSTQATLLDLSEVLDTNAAERPGDSVGQVWGVQVAAGGRALLEMKVANQGSKPLFGVLSIVPPAGVLLSGVVAKLRFELQPGESKSHQFAAMAVGPGLHPLDVRDVELCPDAATAPAAPNANAATQSADAASADEQGSHLPPDVSLDKFLLYCA